MTMPLEPTATSGDPTTAATAPITTPADAAATAAIVPPSPAVPAVQVPPRKPAGGRAAGGRAAGGRWVNVLLGAAALLAVGGVAFAVGRTTAPASAVGFVGDGGPMVIRPDGSFDPGAAPDGVRPGGPGFLAAGGLTLEGTVTAVDADSITVRLASGEEQTIQVDDATTYHEATAADPSAVAVGDEVAVQADGGRVRIDAGGGTGSNAAPELTAGDVTVRR